jgi:hypothetical protein
VSVSQKNPKGIKHLIEKLAKEVSITVGIHATDGAVAKETPGDSVLGATLGEIAEAHEFGIGVPNRSFVGGWVDAKEDEARRALAAVMKPVAEGKADQAQASARFGLWAAGQMQQRIADGIAPELAPSTLAHKEALTGEAKETPLILTGQLRSSIRSKVEIGGKSEH